jgi:Fe-S cluster assembly ATPase SufC
MKYSNGDVGTKLAILDETDSGLDIDALRIVANGVNKLKSDKNAIVVITHYQRLDHIVPISYTFFTMVKLFKLAEKN